MSDQKIPDRSDFLKKFTAVEGFLQKKTEPESKPDNKKNEETNNSKPIIAEIPKIEQEPKCNKCGTAFGPEDIFCGICGNKLKDQ